jgi:GR25 family glycosyltransferase involved in LPS biosynthesis
MQVTINSILVYRYTIESSIYDIKNGNHGCAKSYLKLISEAKEQNLDMTIICEDDIIITNKDIVESRFIGIMEWLTNNMDKWDIFNFSPSCVGRYSPSAKLELLDKTNNIVKLPFCSSATFMIFNKSSYDKMLNYNFKFPIDNYIGTYFNTTSSVPYLFIQRNDFSNTINKQRKDLEKLFLKSENFIKLKLRLY